MSTRYHGDCCPACGSYQVTPYAVMVGATEEYRYQCQVCEVMWPVMIYTGDSTPASSSDKSPAG